GSSRRNAVARLMPSPFPRHTREEEERLFNEMAHWYKHTLYEHETRSPRFELDVPENIVVDGTERL
ncbi:hypothetical protein MW887_011597, partial [Aspergillus wentii]